LNKTLSKIFIILFILLFASGGMAGFLIGYNLGPSIIESTPAPPTPTPSPTPTNVTHPLSNQNVTSQSNITLLYPRLYSLLVTGYPVKSQAEETQKDTYLYPEELGSIFFMDLLVLLRKTFNCTNIWINDNYLSLTSLEQAKNFTAGNKNIPFLYEGHDCDNFAYQLLGYWSQGNTSFAFGYARSQLHSFNFMVDCNLDVYVVEPMTNEFILYEQIKEEIKDCHYATEYSPISMCLV
jgi:hypothetical protein